MTVPLDAIRVIHYAFRKDIQSIDTAAFSAAKGEAGMDIVMKRYSFFNEILVWHAAGEEEFVFTALESVAPLVAEPYERDHRGLDSLYETLDKAIAASDILATARITAAFRFHLDIHLNKEEAHLYRIFNEKIQLPDQGVIAGKMAQKIPQDRFPEAVSWLFPLIRQNDRENMIRIWQQTLPEPAFVKAAQLIKAAIPDDWAELTSRIPELK